MISENALTQYLGHGWLTASGGALAGSGVVGVAKDAGGGHCPVGQLVDHAGMLCGNVLSFCGIGFQVIQSSRGRIRFALQVHLLVFAGQMKFPAVVTNGLQLISIVIQENFMR